jgi:HEAT repeat protein
MMIKLRFPLRKLMIWIGLVAALMALLRYPYTYIEAEARFSSRSRQGYALIHSYRALCPTGVSKANWDDAVGAVQTAWSNVVFSRFQFREENSLGRIVDQMQSLVARATPAEAEGDIYLILDLLAESRSRISLGYLSARRADVKRAIHGCGRPSPDLIGYALRRAGPRPGQTALATITEGLRANDWQLRVACCRALGQYGLDRGSQGQLDITLSALIRALDDDNDLVREIAVESLHAMGPIAARAGDRLIQKLHADPSARVRLQAARALIQVDKELKSVVPALIAATQDSDPDVRFMANWCLGETGTTVNEGSPALPRARQDER